jgi:hypothetical protein
MEDTKKKKIAAITAVLHYLETEEESALEMISANRSVPASVDNFWNFSGRQAQMMTRNMVQMRLFPGWKR